MTRKQLAIAALLCIIGAGTVLRLWKVEYIPNADDADELAYVLAGQSWLQLGVPVSWSSFSYEATNWKYYTAPAGVVSRPNEWLLIRSWFDHPLLMPTWYGIISHALSQPFFTMPPAYVTRLPMVFFASLSMVLIFLLGRELFGTRAGLWSAALVAASPVLIFGQRMLVGDNIITFFLLAAIYLALRKYPLWLIGMVGFLAANAKVTGIVVFPAISMLLLFQGNWRNAILFSLGGVGVFGLWYWWLGSMIDATAFFEALRSQSYRLIGWSNPASWIAKPGFQNYLMFDFSYFMILILGFGSGVYAAKSWKHRFAFALVIALTGLLWTTSAEQSMLGWYKLPLFTFLALASGTIIQARSYALPIALLAIAIISNFGMVRYPTSPLPSTELLRTVVGGGIGVLLLSLIWYEQIKKYLAPAVIVLLVLFFVQSGYVVHKQFEARCTDVICVTPLVTSSGALKSIFQTR